MAYTLLTQQRLIFVNSLGVPYPNAKIYTYRAGTTTPLTTYADSAGATPNSNPITSDANGLFAPIYFAPGSGYDLRMIVKDQYGSTISDDDNIPREISEANNLTLSGDLTTSSGANITLGRTLFQNYVTLRCAYPYRMITDTTATLDKGVWAESVLSNVWSIATLSDALALGKNVISATRGSGTAISQIDIGNSTDNPTINVNGSLLVSSTLATGTLTDCTTAPTITVYLSRSAKMATASFGVITGTSNTGSLTLTGAIPVNFQPARQQYIACQLVNNGINEIGVASVGSGSDTITFFRGDGSAFTAAGTKGIPLGASLTWGLS